MISFLNDGSVSEFTVSWVNPTKCVHFSPHSIGFYAVSTQDYSALLENCNWEALNRSLKKKFNTVDDCLVCLVFLCLK